MFALLPPVLALLFMQLTVGLALLCPKPIARAAASFTTTSMTSAAGKSVIVTISTTLLAIFGASVYEIATLGKEKAVSSEKALMLVADQSKAQLSAALSLVTLSLTLFLRKLAMEMHSHEKLKTSQAALLKQVSGLQEQYHRMTDQQSSDGTGGDAALKKKVDDLIKQKQKLEGDLDAATVAKKTAETNLNAMVSQTKALDREFDRLNDENKQLQRRLAQYEATPDFGSSKKDM